MTVEYIKFKKHDSGYFYMIVILTFTHVSRLTRRYFTIARKVRRYKMHDNSQTKVLILSKKVKFTKKFGCVGRGDLTSLFKSCEIDRSQGRLV